MASLMLLDELSDAELGVWFEQISAEAVAAYGGAPHPYRYGPDDQQVIDLWGDPGAPAWVLSLHGGYFSAEYDRVVNEPLTRRLAAAGLAVANVEYRRTGSVTHPMQTVDDVRAAATFVRELMPKGTPLVALGHSAGGYLALVAATCPEVDAAVALAPVVALRETACGGWDGGWIAHWVGGSPDDLPERWADQELTAVGPVAVPTVIIHGTLDKVVPIHLSQQFVSSSDGTALSLREIPGAGHYEFLDPSTSSADLVEESLRELAGLVER